MKIVKPLLLAVSLIMSSSVWAEGGSDRVAQQAQKQLQASSVVLLEAEKAAPGQQRQAKMAEHMQMMDDAMQLLHGDHPPADATHAQHMAWMEEHDKLMGELVQQMQREHKLMMSECKM